MLVLGHMVITSGANSVNFGRKKGRKLDIKGTPSHQEYLSVQVSEYPQ